MEPPEEISGPIRSGPNYTTSPLDNKKKKTPSKVARDTYKMGCG